MGHEEDRQTPCGNNGCRGWKVTVYVYNDDGDCISQHMWPCNVCGQ
ncbi:hypothetical protein [Streptomyces sp. NRRL F-5126]|nr:hypothetical protein [Streptomyces sp. NRRL F-5126]